jgi:hypothetical protein
LRYRSTLIFEPQKILKRNDTLVAPFLLESSPPHSRHCRTERSPKRKASTSARDNLGFVSGAVSNCSLIFSIAFYFVAITQKTQVTDAQIVG